MASRTGTQLKSDAAAGDVALAAAISAPSIANIQTAVAAYTTVRQNAADSITTIKTSDASSQAIARDVQAHANTVIRELNSILAKFSNSSAAELRLLLTDVQRRLTVGTWSSILSKPTTN